MTESDAELPLVTNVSLSNVELVNADLVRLYQSASGEIHAGEVGLHTSAALSVRTDNIDSHETALGLVDAKEVTLTNSGVAAIRAGTVGVDGGVGLVVAQTVNLGNSHAGVIVGREVKAERIESIVLIGNHVVGDVRTVMDTRQAVLAGLIGGLVAGLILALGRFSFHRD
jgi:hypothetical protein